MKSKKMSQGNCFVLLFFAVLFAIFYSRASYLGHKEKVDKHHQDDQRHLKVSEALKYGSKAAAAGNYGRPRYPTDIQRTNKRPFVDSNYNVGDPRGEMYNAKRKRLALKLVKAVLRNRIKTLMRAIELQYIRKQKMKMRAIRSLRMYARKEFFDGKTYSKTEIFFKRLDNRMYSDVVHVFLGKRGNRKRMFFRMVKLRKLGTVKWMILAMRRSY